MKRLVFAIIAFFAASFTANATTSDTWLSLRDTTLRGDSHNLNEGANTVLLVGEMDQEEPDEDDAEGEATTGETDVEGEGEESESGRVLVAFLLPQTPIKVTKATLVLTINSDMPPFGWEVQDEESNLLDAYRLAADWPEGNGNNLDLPKFQRMRGTGSGATWVCPADADISNRTPTCNPKVRWDGAVTAVMPRTSPAAPVSDGLAGELSWDVTQDVLDGAVNGWVIMKRREDAGGTIRFHSREAAMLLGDRSLAPRLVLEGLVFEVGSAGGTIFAAGGDVTLTIPAGAVPGPAKVEITVDSVDPSAVAADVGLLPNSVYDLGPEGFEFSAPVELAVRYNPAEIPPGIPESELILVTAMPSSNAWVEIVSSVDPGLDLVRASVRHFSRWGISPQAVTVAMESSELEMDLDTMVSRTASPQDVSGSPRSRLLGWFSDDPRIVGVSNGIVSALEVGSALVSAEVVRLDASGVAVPGARRSTRINVSSRRLVSFEGSIYILDHDNASADEQDWFPINPINYGVCFLTATPTASVREASFPIGGDFTCVDDEVMVVGKITCLLDSNNRTVSARIEATLYESDECPNDDEDGSGSSPYWRVYDTGEPFQAPLLRINNTAEGGDYAEIIVTAKNKPWPPR